MRPTRIGPNSGILIRTSRQKTTGGRNYRHQRKNHRILDVGINGRFGWSRLCNSGDDWTSHCGQTPACVPHHPGSTRCSANTERSVGGRLRRGHYGGFQYWSGNVSSGLYSISSGYLHQPEYRSLGLSWNNGTIFQSKGSSIEELLAPEATAVLNGDAPEHKKSNPNASKSGTTVLRPITNSGSRFNTDPSRNNSTDRHTGWHSRVRTGARPAILGQCHGGTKAGLASIGH